ncbi:peptide-N4-asparagine amidase [Frateuria hangzhouensis]|uniref:peptide-N4-asparagine amidase n=1 Tax=Frateuria hangzhouensis TaxID=2995589 RepID=UPI0022608E7E|nr:peptide-N4-asparagine amidase [Frateuria sp. STR12]MCX7514537.1 hypothetical protein [Frateuria sp. STR12]
MSTQSVRQRLTQAALPAVILALLVPSGAQASPQEAIERAGPPVPVPRSQPCEVQLFRDATFGDDAGYVFAPPVRCPPPWAKVTLDMDLSGTDRARGIAVALKGVTLFVGPTPGTREPSSWHVERDLTDYSALFKEPGTGTLRAVVSFRPAGNLPTVGTATLRFYPPTAAQPAPRVPDAVFSTYTAMYPPDLPYGDSTPPIKDLAALPHNIERAYLDVTANDNEFWFACLTPELADAHPTLVSRVALGLAGRGLFPPPQGCFPSSYFDVGITVDGTPAGVAPVFPWLPTDFSFNQGPRPRSAFWNVLDTPTDSAQSLDYVPYRVDLSPFAAILNEAGPHQVVLHMPRWASTNLTSYFGPRNANLLVYLDHGKARLSGAVTYNSLSAAQPQPAIKDDLTQKGDLLQGRVRTRLDRNFRICGYVDTSHGRVHSSVVQQSQFHNVQQFHVKDDASDNYDLPVYREDLWLETATQSVSRRTQGGHLLSEDRQKVSYPLEMHYVGIGRLTTWYSGDDYDVDVFGGSVSVDQHRRADTSHYRRGLEPYRTHLREEFYGNHRVDPDTGASSHWHAAHTFTFHDNRGSCYQKAVTTRNGALDDTATGMDCARGTNHVRWFAHPDGSADGLGWQRP